MIILFEGCKYETVILNKYLNNRFFLPVHDPCYSIVNYVGYYYSPIVNDVVIILPKVFIYSNGLAFGKYLAKDILVSDIRVKIEMRKDGIDKLLFSISTWIYRAILQYRKRQKETSLIEKREIKNIICNLGESDSTELDIILSLLDFHKKNRSLFTYISKLNHKGQSVNWKKTFNKKIPIISNNIPIYTSIYANNKSKDYNEKLIVLYYSVLNYINLTYGFNISFDQNYCLIKGRNFEKILKKGTSKMRSLKNHYLSDKFLALWNLLYLFFKRSESNRKSRNKFEEVLLIKKFNIVFEDMIDDLIGDNTKNIPHYFKDQLDGKKIDHLYRYPSLFKNDDIYFVGDSKYYKPENNVSLNSIEKQYTYAKNIIQYNINLFNMHKLPNGIRYRDTLTEGYNITPNFFISAVVDENYDFLNDGLSAESNPKESEIQYHFKNRLFDRDTLFIQTYNINFLFVLLTYTSKSTLLKKSFKIRAHKHFRSRMIDYFRDNYIFYLITPKIKSLEDLITKYFRKLNGKMYRPSQMDDSMIVAFLKKNNTIDIIDTAECYIEEYVIF